MDQVKICPSCGLENPLSEIMCLRCMADISCVNPEEKNHEGHTSKSVRLINGDIGTLTIKEGSIVGRDAEGHELLEGFLTVSRKHARFILNDNLEVEDLNSTNGTWVNGRRLNPGEKCKINSGDIISLSKSCTFSVE